MRSLVILENAQVFWSILVDPSLQKNVWKPDKTAFLPLLGLTFAKHDERHATIGHNGEGGGGGKKRKVGNGESFWVLR